MLLKFIGDTEKPDSIPSSFPFVIGETYDVAEIFEHPWHLMVRKPGEKAWPRPGDSSWGWHPEFFETTDQPIEIVSCGHVAYDYLCDCFGTIVDEPKNVVIARQFTETFEQTDLPEEGEDFDAWRSRTGDPFGHRVARCVYDMDRHPIGPPEALIHEGTSFSECDLRFPFVSFAYWSRDLASHNARATDAKQLLDRLIGALGLQAHKAQVLDHVSYWKDEGAPRLINAPRQSG